MEHLISSIKTLKEKGRIQQEINYQNILVVYSNDKVYAIMDKCPHRGVTLANGTIENDVIKCKDHGLGISLETGDVLSQRQIDFLRLDKYSRNVKTYETIVKDGNVYVVM